LGVRTQHNGEDSRYSNGTIKILFESHAASRACFYSQLPVPIEAVKKLDDTVNVTWLNAPAAIETPNVTRRCGPIRPDVE